MWDVVYRDKAVDLPPISGMCSGWYVDIDTGLVLNGSGLSSDLHGMIGCTKDGVFPDNTNGNTWGTSTAAQPTAQECYDSVKNNPVGTVSFDEFALHAAFCMITSKRNVA
jgi:hypothetical protein